jgi:4-hydroxybenzoate polyprenyltransferase
MTRLFALIRLMRPLQWVKNGFVFVGLLFGHAWTEATLVTSVVLAFSAFCLISSAIYTFNDIMDREQDRLHPAKCSRPLACGIIQVNEAGILALLLGAAAIIMSNASSPIVLYILLGYALMNVAYSISLKHVVILDVFIIAAGFMLRILAGTLGVGIQPSQWLLLCGLMVTLFLGFAKRRAEIIALSDDRVSHRRVLEHYSPLLLDKMIGITATGMIMSYSLYTMSADTIRIHGTANLVYTVPFVMYGVFRYIYLLHHHSMGGDPSNDLLHDAHLIIVIFVWLISTIAMIL